MKKWIKLIGVAILLAGFWVVIKDMLMRESTLAANLEYQEEVLDASLKEDEVELEVSEEESEIELEVSEKVSEEESDEIVFFENIQMITDPNCYLVLVNKNHALSSTFSPTDLVLPQVLTSQNPVNTHLFMRERPARMLEDMFQAAMDEEGLVLLARSGYRSYATQQVVHSNFVNQVGQEAAEQFSARPGHSEHQTGLAIDITADSVQRALVIGFGETSEGQWLNANAHRFGFILRYPPERIAETGFQYEPWHFRYVGIESATEIFEQQLILEDYLK